MLMSKMMRTKLSAVFPCFIILALTTITTAVNAATLTWQSNLPNLPAPTGEASQHGVAGAFSGRLKTFNNNSEESEVIIVAGGTNFSKQPLLEAITADVGAEKTYHQEIYLLSKKSTKQYQWQQVKISFFSQPPKNFNWNKDALLFDSASHTWSNLGETPFLPNGGAAIEQWQDGIVLISGEIKPGVRTPTVKMASFNNNKRILL